MRLLFISVLILMLSGFDAPAAEPEIWFAPNSRADMVDLWSDDAPWQNAASHVNVLQVVSWWLVSATDQQILSLFDFAKRHHMKVEMETSVIARYLDQTCGDNEGYTAVDEMAGQFAVLQRLHLHIDILTMDEPVSFGHYMAGPVGCMLSVPDLVDRIMVNVQELFTWYPDLEIVEIEPFPVLSQNADWRDVLTAFRLRMAEKTGKQIKDLQMDLDWGNPDWPQTAHDVRDFAHHNGMGLGVYMYGGAYDLSDAQWIGEAVSHMEAFEGMYGILPDQAIFASWSQFPVYTMPETAPTTLTWLIDHYALERSRLQAHFTGQGVAGRLTDGEGHPMPNETISGVLPGVDFSQPLPVTLVQQTVPAGAAYGLLGYRLNAECNCDGNSDVLVGQLQYQETSGGSASYSWTFPFVNQLFNGVLMSTELVGGTQVTRAIANAGDSLVLNSGFFPVTQGAQYTYSIPAGTPDGKAWYGHVLLYWFDQNYNGLNGDIFVLPDPGSHVVSTAVTDADGRFYLDTLPHFGPGQVPVQVRFTGDATHRGVTWTPLQ